MTGNNPALCRFTSRAFPCLLPGRPISRFTTRLVLLVLAGFAQGVVSAPAVKVINTTGFPWDGVAEHQQDSQGRSWIAYYDVNRTLHLRQPDGVDVVMTPPHREQAAPAGLAMTGLDAGIGVMWRDKLPSKGLFLAQSSRLDIPPIDLGGDTEPLPRINLLRRGPQLHIAWLGEKIAPDLPKYNIYVRSLDLATQEPTPIERLMPGYYPTWAQDDRGGIMAFSWYYYGTSRRIVARYRAPDAATFGEEVRIAEAEDISPNFRAFYIHGRWLLFWVAYDKTAGTVEFQGATSEDLGRSWTSIRFDIPGVQIGSQTLAWDDQGHALMALSVRQPDWPMPRQEIRLTGSADGGKTWSPMASLRPVAMEKAYNARHPMLVMGPEPGQVLVVWEDWREIRGRIYFSLSHDFGQTWVHNDVPLPIEPNTNLRLAANADHLYLEDGRYHLLVTQADDDSLESARLLEVSFTLADLEEAARLAAAGVIPAADVTGAAISQGQAAPTSLPPRSEERLRQRVAAYWTGMMNQDFLSTYALLDPFFRANNDQVSYFKRLGRISYSAFNIKDVHIDGWRAEVNTLVQASIPPFRASTGEMISQDEKEVPISEIWLWMGDDWYRESYDAAKDHRSTKY